MMRRIDPRELETKVLHQYVLSSVAPRPIAFASTVDENGTPNIAPFSFFNAFSSNPPILVFSANRRVKDNTTKDTLHNIKATGEVVINVVNHEIVRQMALASIEYPAGIDEFKKSGLTPIDSEKVKPLRIKESPVQYECKVQEVISLGDKGGAGNLIICHVELMHMSEEIFTAEDKIDPNKIDLVGRLGRAYYCRASGESVFSLHQPVNVMAIGYDQLPGEVKNSEVLSGNDLGALGGVEKLPVEMEINAKRDEEEIRLILESDSDRSEKLKKLHFKAKERIGKGDIMEAWKILLQKI